MKKVLIVFSIVLAVVLVFCLLFLPYLIDDMACDKYKKEIDAKITGVDEINFLDSMNKCGNVANGNHTYLVVNALIETELTIESVKYKFPDAYRVMPFEELYSESKEAKQFSKRVMNNGKNYFVLIYAKSAPFYFIDFRGH